MTSAGMYLSVSAARARDSQQAGSFCTSLLYIMFILHDVLLGEERISCSCADLPTESCMTRTLTKIPVDVSGATNRVDALDAALRRPGRFDRELVFPLPSLHARASILGIHTRAWAQPPTPDLLERLAQMSVGYCGADLKVRQKWLCKF